MNLAKFRFIFSPLFAAVFFVGCAGAKLNTAAESSEPMRKLSSMGSLIPESFLRDWTYYVNHGGIATLQAQYIPGNHQLQFFFRSTRTPNRAGLSDYRLTFSCRRFGEPCEILNDEMRFAKNLIVYPDGSMLYENNQGTVTSLVNRDAILDSARK